MGMSLQDYLETIDAEWSNQVKPGCLPAHWRDRRNIYQLALQGGGWWIDIEHPDSIAAISSALGKRLHDELGLERLTLGVPHGENRAATPMAASWTRDQVLEDGSYPLGITCTSKHGGGRFWAYWLRRRDSGLEEVQMKIASGDRIPVDYPAMRTVTERFGIKLW